MPTYEYECPRCPRVFEVRQRISEPALTTCDICGGPIRRLLAATPFILKGGGWYVTDYPSESRKKALTSESSGDKTSGDKTSGDKTSGDKTSSKSDQKSDGSSGTTSSSSTSGSSSGTSSSGSSSSSSSGSSGDSKGSSKSSES